jgi:hypothetical protein
MDQADGEKRRPSGLGARGGRALIYPEFILSSATNHLLFMLTFGLMSPALAVAIGFVTATTTFFWEILIGRFLCREAVRSGRPRPHSTGQGMGMGNEHVFSAAASLKHLDGLCETVCCAPRQLLSFLALASACFFALIALDMAGDQQGWLVALWAPLSFLLLSLLLLLFFDRPDPAHPPAPSTPLDQQQSASVDGEELVGGQGQEQGRDTISRQLSARFSSFEIERPPTIRAPIKFFS